MPNDAYTQQALAADGNFRKRVSAALASVSWQVLEEPDTVPEHQARAAYARQVLAQTDYHANTICAWLVMRPNVINFETSYSFPAGCVVTASGDADLQSQLMSDWNDFAGIPPPPGPGVLRE